VLQKRMIVRMTTTRRKAMKLRNVFIAGLAGAAVGASAVQILHAQSKAPAYLVAEIDVTNPDLYKEYLAKGGPLYGQFGGRFLVRGGRLDAFAGEAPKRAVIAVFESLEKAQAFRDSPAYRELVPVRDEPSKFRAYLAEGVPN
jgi:uncharacterized protein (DUF1330 family)